MENFRYLLLILGALSVGFVYCNRVAFNFTVICQEPANKTEISGSLSIIPVDDISSRLLPR